MCRAATLVALALASGCVLDDAGPTLDRRAAAIVDGEDDPDDPAVVALTTGGQQFCTGTLVAPRVVVTAAHCLPPNLDVPASSIDVFFGSRVGQGGTLIAADEVVVHPAWNQDVVPNDIGLLSLVEDGPTAPLSMIGAGDPAQVDEAVKLVGFGITVAEGDDNGLKRKGSATIDREDDSTIFLAGAPSLTCNGDSGGPLFVQRGGEWVFAGIHSRSNCETEALNERVDRHLDDRIAPFIAAHGGGACVEDGVCDEACAGDPDCGGGEPPPGVAGDLVGGCAAGSGGASRGLAALALGLAALLRRRRR